MSLVASFSSELLEGPGITSSDFFSSLSSSPSCGEKGPSSPEEEEEQEWDEEVAENDCLLELLETLDTLLSLRLAIGAAILCTRTSALPLDAGRTTGSLSSSLSLLLRLLVASLSSSWITMPVITAFALSSSPSVECAMS